MEEIICSCGCVCKAGQKFCTECGAPLMKSSASVQAENRSEAGTQSGIGSISLTDFAPGLQTGFSAVYSPSKPEGEPVNVYPDDRGLKLMAEFCEKTGPLAYGMVRYTETALYYDPENDGYQVHYYAGGSGSEIHKGYHTTKEHAEKVMRSIDTEGVREAEVQMPMTGGERVFLFRNEQDEIVRVECVSSHVVVAAAKVSSLMSEAMREEDRIVPEYAKNWKQFSVDASGMSMDSCYRYQLERSEPDRVRVKGYCFLKGSRHELSDWRELTGKEREILEKIPLGLMLSDRTEKRDPAFIGFVMTDGEKKVCEITYGDGKTDTKIPDGEMISALDTLMRSVFAKKRLK